MKIVVIKEKPFRLSIQGDGKWSARYYFIEPRLDIYTNRRMKYAQGRGYYVRDIIAEMAGLLTGPELAKVAASLSDAEITHGDIRAKVEAEWRQNLPMHKARRLTEQQAAKKLRDKEKAESLELSFKRLAKLGGAK